MDVGTENQVDNIIIRFFIGGIQPEGVHEAVKQPKISDINNVIYCYSPSIKKYTLSTFLNKTTYNIMESMVT